MSQIADLASLMGHSESEVARFVECLAVFTRKGYSVEQAIEMSQRTWRTMLDRAHDAVSNEHSRYRGAFNALKAQAVDAFCPAEVA